MGRCNICNKEVKDIPEHYRRHHKLSRKSIEYLLKLDIPKEKILKILEEQGLSWPEEVNLFGT